MIISASRRTDIPAFYSEWLINRLKEGYVLIRKPRNPNRSSQIKLSPDTVDCIVFWTKNPEPMLDKLSTVKKMGYQFYFQFTLTPYDKHIEKGLPPKPEIMETFKRLSDMIGPKRVVWRYDPIITGKGLSVQYHLNAYGKMADILGDYTESCIFSFVDLYAKIKNRSKSIADCEVNEQSMNCIAEGFSEIARNHSMTLSTCSEAVELDRYGIKHVSCIDQGMIEKIINCPIKAKKDANQRPACGCIESVDIGAYDSCSHGCVYCYANSSCKAVFENMKKHDPNSAILIGQPSNTDIITCKESKTQKIRQQSLI